MRRKPVGWFGAVSFLLLSGLVAGCAVPMARSMVIVPAPRDAALSHVPAFSLAAAERVREEIEARGFAAIVPKSKARPETLVVAEAPSAEFDLTLFVWVRQIDIGKHEGTDDIVTFGGLDLRDRSDQRLAYSSGRLGEPGEPSSELYEVASAADPRALAAAADYGDLVLSASRGFSKKVGPLVGGAS